MKMDRNVRIAKELVRLAKSLVAVEEFKEGQKAWCVVFPPQNAGKDGLIAPKVNKPVEVVVEKKEYNGYNVEIGSKKDIAFPFDGDYSMVDYSPRLFRTMEEANEFYRKVSNDRKWMSKFEPKSDEDLEFTIDREPYEWKSDKYTGDGSDRIRMI